MPTHTLEQSAARLMDRMAADVPVALLDLVCLPLASLHGCRNLSLQATEDVYCRRMKTDVKQCRERWRQPCLSISSSCQLSACTVAAIHTKAQ